MKKNVFTVLFSACLFWGGMIHIGYASEKNACVTSPHIFLLANVEKTVDQRDPVVRKLENLNEKQIDMWIEPMPEQWGFETPIAYKAAAIQKVAEKYCLLLLMRYEGTYYEDTHNEWNSIDQYLVSVDRQGRYIDALPVEYSKSLSNWSEEFDIDRKIYRITSSVTSSFEGDSIRAVHVSTVSEQLESLNSWMEWDEIIYFVNDEGRIAEITPRRKLKEEKKEIKAAVQADSIQLLLANSARSWKSDATTVTLSDDGTLTVSGNGAMADYKYSTNTPWHGISSLITDLVIEEGITHIGNSAFAQMNGLKSVTIPNSVISIGKAAFYGCFGLTSVTLPNSVISIEKETFKDCHGLTSITIGNGVTSIGDFAFENCHSLTSITIPNSVTTIGSRAFANCYSLTSITIPNSVTIIEGYAFFGCTGLTSITLPNSVTTIRYAAFMGCTGLTSITIPDSVTVIGPELFMGCTGLTSITLPNSVKFIGQAAFKNCTGLTSITLPNSVNFIEKEAFMHCRNLTSITIPDSVTTIEERTFMGCHALTTVTIPNGVTAVGEGAFKFCYSLTSINVAADNAHYSSEDGVLFNKDKTVLIQYPQSKQGTYTIPSSVKTIQQYVFSDCSGLTSVTIPNSVTSIEKFAFSDCANLATVNIGSGVKTVGEYAFDGCAGLMSINIAANNPYYSSEDGVLFNKNKTSLILYPRGRQGTYTIPNNITDIEKGAFEGCRGLKSVIFPDSLNIIGKRAFYGCTGLTSITIPDNVTTIGEKAFRSCRSLKSVTIGNSVVSIGEQVFLDCVGLTSIIVKNPTPPKVGDDAFYGIELNNACLYVPESSIDAYRAADVWKGFDCVKDIASYQIINEIVDEITDTTIYKTAKNKNGGTLATLSILTAIILSVAIFVIIKKPQKP